MEKIDTTAKITGRVKKFFSFLPLEKKNISRRARQALTFMLIGLLGVFLAGLLWSFRAQAEEEVEYRAYYYLQEAFLDYRVHTVPNELFSERVLGPDRAYITALTDYLAVDFEYRFLGESEAEISGRYDVKARLSAYTAQEEHLVWEKNYELLPLKSFSQSGEEVLLTERVFVPLSDYLVFSERVREETGYNPAELNLTVSFNVHIEAETGDGAINESMAPVLVIPLKGSTFTVGGNLTEEKEGAIVRTHTVAKNSHGEGTVIFSAMITVTALALMVLRLFTAPGAKGLPSKESEAAGILKKHRERIVLTANGVVEIPTGAITVYSFDELLKLADEVGKPILYPRPAADKDSGHFFMVLTPEQTYAYGIRDRDNEG